MLNMDVFKTILHDTFQSRSIYLYNIYIDRNKMKLKKV